MSDSQQLLMDFDSPEESVSADRSKLLLIDEIYDYANVARIAILEEDDRIERKPPGIHAPVLAKIISMWANTPPDGGLIVVGMSDDGELSGCSSLETEKVNRLCQAGNEYCHDAKLDVKRIIGTRPDGQNDFALLFRVYYNERRVVETNKGDAFYRLGDSRIRLTEDQKRELASGKGQIEFEQEPCGLKWPDDFNSKAIQQFAISVRKTKRTVANHSEREILSNHRLGKIVGGDFVPNIACALLFANDPQQVIPGAMIRFQRIEGDEAFTGEHRNVVKDVFIEGRVPEMIVETAQVIDTQIRNFSRLGPDGKFYSAKEYPRKAWYEAIVNACVHRSYSLKGMNIFVKMYDDRLVVESPGPFPPMVTPQNIYESHYRRNFFLMGALFFLEFVMCENEGTKRMRSSMIELDLPEPEFAESSKDVAQSIVQVTLRNNLKIRDRWIDSDASSIVGAILAKDLTQDDNRIINFVAEHGQIKVRQAERLTGRTWHTAKKILMGLVERGILQYKSKYPRDPNAYFYLSDPKS